jgi:hypothetical protein
MGMKIEQFNDIVSDLFQACLGILAVKKEFYASDYDRLSQFKELAGLTGRDPKEVLTGIMAKHTHSIYLLAGRGDIQMEVWKEKIIDHINYLALLYALIWDEQDNTKGV